MAAKKPTAKRGAKGDDSNYRPRMTDPVSGAKMQRGRAVSAASAAPIDYTKLKTVRPVARVQTAGAFSPPVDKADVGRVKDPVSGEPLKKGSPVAPAFGGALNQRVGLGLSAAGNALKAGFKPPPDSGPAAKGDAMRMKKGAKKKGR